MNLPKTHLHSAELSPTVLVLFGITGDLANHKLIPALLAMEQSGLLPNKFMLIGVGRREWSFGNWLAKHYGQKTFSATVINKFSKRVRYVTADVEKVGDFKLLKKFIEQVLPHTKHKPKLLFFLAVSPGFFPVIARGLARVRLLQKNSHTRLLVEKPFGSNLATAKTLNHTLGKILDEKQIFRVDHYLGKETVQNLLVARFANDIFEPIWNQEYIDHIQISVLEQTGVSHRAEFYNAVGVIRDVVQNHILEMLALLCMERPDSLNPDQVRDKKVAVLRALKPIPPKELSTHIVLGQYSAGGGEKSFVSSLGRPSQTATFTVLKVFINNKRFAGVPIYIRTGKNLTESRTELSVHFKKRANTLFIGQTRAHNVLSFRIQPNESVDVLVNTKQPGFDLVLHQAQLQFAYASAFQAKLEPYERLLKDFFDGDQSLFIRSDEVSASWKFIDHLLEPKEFSQLPVHLYKSGGKGPRQADQFITQDKRTWY